MNFDQLKQEVKRFTGRNDSQFDDRIEKALNRALIDWARQFPWDGLRVTGEITHLGGRILSFPSEIERVVWLMDKTNQGPVYPSDHRWDRNYAENLAQNTVNYAIEWEPAGVAAVHTSVSNYISVYSTHASDVVTLYITGQCLRVGGTEPLDLFQTGETVNLVGATPVTLSQQYRRIDSIVKDVDTNGLITVAANGGVVGLIGPFDLEARYQQIRFMDIPTAGTVFMYGALVRPAPLRNAYQSPPPSVNPDFLIWKAAADIFWQLREGDRYQGALAEAGRAAAETRTVETMFGDYGSRIVPEDYTE